MNTRTIVTKGGEAMTDDEREDFEQAGAWLEQAIESARNFHLLLSDGGGNASVQIGRAIYSLESALEDVQNELTVERV